MLKGGGRRAVSDDALYYDGFNTRWDQDGYDDFRAARPVLPPDDDDLLIQRTLDRIRLARERGHPNVNLSHEELDALTRPRLQHFSAPASSDPAPARPASKGRASAASSTRSKKSSSRPSFLSSSPRSSRTRSRKPESSSSSKRRNSSANDSDVPPAAPPPGFRIPGAGAAPLGYASGPSSRPDSRRASGSIPGVPRGDFSYDSVPVAFRDYMRPSSRDSFGLSPAEEAEYLARHASRSRSGSSAPGYPPPPYPSFAYERERGRPGDADPFMYQTNGPGAYPGSSASSSPSSQRRTASGPTSGVPLPNESVAYTAIPRRVPVPMGAVPAAGGSRLAGVAGLGQGSISDPALGYRNSGHRARDLEVEVEYDPPSGSSGSSGESEGVHQGVRIVGPESDARGGVRDRIRGLERDANASGRNGSGSGSGSSRKRKGKRR